MIVIDTNILLVLIIGLIDPRRLNIHKRTSIYDEDDYYSLIKIIAEKKLITTPNVWTEVDNLLNESFSRADKNKYVNVIQKFIANHIESYIPTIDCINNYTFFDLGITDSALLSISKKEKLLITGDSKLADYAIANGINVFDLKANANTKFL